MGAGVTSHIIPGWKAHSSKQQTEQLMWPLPSRGSAQTTKPVLLQGFLSSDEIQLVKSLSDKLTSQGLSNDTTFSRSAWCRRNLHADGFVQREAPSFVAKLRDAALQGLCGAGIEEWAEICRSPSFETLAKRLKPRCIEHHIVSPGGSLSDPHHVDEGSLITLDVMLSRPSTDFGGGDFCTLEGVGNNFDKHYFGQGDAILFVSHKMHCIRHVHRGRREVLVVELWEGAPGCTDCRSESRATGS
eukprot:TRINITY_DN31308_c0_g1_i1.p1 TRINITY_DN31308_c0_g1~~TRINITY_DN31308_c0_g1_i1.p1  ORF type:complete len:244 (-),score=27.51 TRINITY_DN31308_c0_g1_i1:408-1139(-)